MTAVDEANLEALPLQALPFNPVHAQQQRQCLMVEMLAGKSALHTGSGNGNNAQAGK